MGIVLLPIYTLAIAVCVLNLVFLIKKSNKGEMASKWSFPLGVVIMIVIYAIVVLSWSTQDKIWALTPLMTLPFTNVILPGLAGLGGLFIPKKYKMLNIIGFALCFSALISMMLIIGASPLTQADTFIDIEITH